MSEGTRMKLEGIDLLVSQNIRGRRLAGALPLKAIASRLDVSTQWPAELSAAMRASRRPSFFPSLVSSRAQLMIFLRVLMENSPSRTAA
jgi:hypothetical protein